jgi:uncharacterized protein (DUF302 family)
MRAVVLAFLLSAMASLAAAQSVTQRPGWVVIHSDKNYRSLTGDLVSAVKANGMGVVTKAGPTEAAKSRGIAIPGNLVVGVFNNDFAVRVLETSTAAMIEAPIRFYITEDAQGATLSYKTPSHVFAPYLDEGGPALTAIAAELDGVFQSIALQATTKK